MENGPHYRYVADLWTIPKEIANNIEYKYILDIVDHFSKWYYGYPLKTKEAKEVCRKIEIFCENFGLPKILQTDNGKEFDNKILNDYCLENNIKLIHSSPYHPQTNGTVEATHKEIQKYILNEYMKNKSDFNIEDVLFEIIRIHNNKIHSTTKRIPKEIRDIEDADQINEIKDEIVKTLQKKNKNSDIINYDKFYVLNTKDILIKDNMLIKAKKSNKKNKKEKNQNKIPINVICNLEKEDYYMIEIKKSSDNFKEGELYESNIELLEEVNKDLWMNLL